MSIIKLSKNYRSSEPLALAIGLFDGVHKGHKELLKTIKNSGYKPAVLTFSNLFKDKHNSSFFLSSLEDRERILQNLGIDTLFYLEFEDIKNVSPLDFIEDYLSDLNIATLVVGEDFRFGRKAEGDIALLRKTLKHSEVIDIPLLSENGEKLSTTSIIARLEAGDVESATKDLDRYYQIRGVVNHGLANGTKLGFPTANISLTFPYVIPKAGVYETRLIYQGHRYLSMTNIGCHPTISKLTDSSIEVHIIDFHKDIYGEEVALDFIEYLRPEVKFATTCELQAQLRSDRERILSHNKKH